MTSTPVDGDPETQDNTRPGLHFLDTRNQPSVGHQHPHLDRARNRLRHFLHPDGKKIHIADSPQEALKLRQQLQALHHDSEFDVVISGGPEHLEALRKAHRHHRDQKENLRKQHPEVFDSFAIVHADLDALASELDRVTSHGVTLEAHFNKYGYDAHIRSYDDESPSASGATTPRSRKSSETGRESSAEKGYATPLKLFKVPVVRQYFHKGTLWRASSAEEVQSFELFVDLLYVGIIAINGDAASEDATGLSLLHFVITFALSWKIWNDMAMVISWFETDDVFQRLSILFLMGCLFGYTTNIREAFNASESTYATLIGFLLAARIYMGLYLVLVAWLVPMIRNIMIWYITITMVSVGLWIGSIHVPYPQQMAVIWVAMLVDVCGPLIYFFMFFSLEKFGPKTKAWVEKTFEFYPAINIEHRTERMNAFVTLVFGYTVVSLLYQTTRNGIDAHYGKAVLGLTQAFCFNWLYFEVDGANLNVHAIRRHRWSSFAWTSAHLPFIMAFVLAGGALAKLVLAVDTPNSHLDYLTGRYQRRADTEIVPGIRWFYCAGLGVALAFMGFISISHVHKEIEGLRLKKKWRLCARFSVSIILICLPAADRLDSLQLVGTVSALIVFVLVLELWCASSCHEKLLQRSK